MKQILNNRLLLGLLVIFMFVFPLLVNKSNYFMTLFVMTSIYIIAAMALNLLTGYGGQISIGHAAFLSIGGYSVAILSSKLGLSIWLTLPLAGVITAFVGLLIGLPAVRLRGHFLAVATLGFGLSIPQIALKWDSVTGGYSGLPVQKPELLSSSSQFFYVVVVVTILVVWLMHNIVKSRLGRAFLAIRESEVAAQSTGVNIVYYKVIMFVLSAFFTGIAGGLYGYWAGYVSPNDFTITTSLLLLAMIVIGGLASLPGAAIGAVLFSILPHFTDKFVGITNIVIGIAVVFIILFRPSGIVSLFPKKKVEFPFGDEGMTQNDRGNG